MFKYSIIIPVYNAEKFLNSCVQSILNQTYNNYEIVLVDDGSTDSSPDICDELAKLHPQKIKVIHSENGGTSSARNIGLENATGDYIGFMDNDDHWRFENALADIDKSLTESSADMLVYGTSLYMEKENVFVDEGASFRKDMIAGKNLFSAIRIMVKHGFMNFTVWSKFVKKSIIIENKIVFPKNKRNEDTAWLCSVLEKINSVDAYSEFFYAYRRGNDYSQTSKPLQRKHVDDLKDILIENIDKAKVLETPRRAMIYDFLCQAYTVWLSQIGFFGDKESDVKEIKERLYILKYGSKPYVKFLRAFICVFGIQAAIKVLNFLLVKRYPFLKESGKQNENLS